MQTADSNNDGVFGDLLIKGVPELTFGVAIIGDAVLSSNAIMIVDGSNLPGNDTIHGTAGDDTISAGAGTDTVDGLTGSDNLTGGAGDDFFRLTANQTAGDVITDFVGAGTSGGDRLSFEGFGAGAALSNAGDDWTVTYSGGSETFEITGVTALTDDYSFA